MTKNPAARPPKSLTREGKRVWRALQADYQIDDAAGLALLERALLALDRADEARRLIAEHGPLVRDRFGQFKTNPMIAVERDAMKNFLAALSALHLDIEPANHRIGRPGGDGPTPVRKPRLVA